METPLFENGPVGQDGAVFRLDAISAAAKLGIMNGTTVMSVPALDGTLCVRLGVCGVVCRIQNTQPTSTVSVLSACSADRVKSFLKEQSPNTPALDKIAALHRLAGGKVIEEEGGCLLTFAPSDEWKDMPSIDAFRKTLIDVR